jgi:16S rRNA processing protein RimM
MDANWVVLARIVRPQGRRGELLADILTDFPEKFASRSRLFLRPENAGALDSVREVNLQAHWFHKNRVVLKFTGVDSINDAEILRKHEVVIPLAERMPLTEDAIYISDLLGMRVLDVSSGSARDAGEVVDVAPEGAGPAMLAVRRQDAEPVLIPFVKAYLKKIDLPAKRIEMELPEGLMAIQAPLTAEERAQQDGKTRSSS